jgi:predicted nucleotidyltransferase
VFLPPAEWNWSLTKPPEQVEFFTEGVEEVEWEVEKFVRLALQANPNILETLWSPAVLHLDETGEELRSIRRCFLSRHLYRTYSGYVLSQFRLMKKGFATDRRYKPKHAMHLIRLLHSGIHALREEEIRVDVAEHRDELLAIRRGEVPFEAVEARALELDRAFQAAFANTSLPERPDTERANQFLVVARRRRVLAREAARGSRLGLRGQSPQQRRRHDHHPRPRPRGARRVGQRARTGRALLDRQRVAPLRLPVSR